jgi:hypothetical protein
VAQSLKETAVAAMGLVAVVVIGALWRLHLSLRRATSSLSGSCVRWYVWVFASKRSFGEPPSAVWVNRSAACGVNVSGVGRNCVDELQSRARSSVLVQYQLYTTQVECQKTA